jgi:KipI family sensor histidine kinase inhibitor
MRIKTFGDSAIVIDVADIEVALRISEFIRREAIPGVIDVAAAYASVTVVHDPEMYDSVREQIERTQSRVFLDPPIDARKPELVEIPVCYREDYAIDLQSVATRASLSPRQVIDLHTRPGYTVGAVGFLPGFAYLLGLDRAIHTPRLAAPRPRVPAGSVGIGAAQTGVYPCDSPGGWNIIGRTPMRMFDPAASPPSRLRVGDRVRFIPISPAEFMSWK